MFVNFGTETKGRGKMDVVRLYFQMTHKDAAKQPHPFNALSRGRGKESREHRLFLAIRPS